MNRHEQRWEENNTWVSTSSLCLSMKESFETMKTTLTMKIILIPTNRTSLLLPTLNPTMLGKGKSDLPTINVPYT